VIQKLLIFLKESFSVNQRSYGWINLARGLIIIMVVYRHAFEGLRNSGLDLSPYYYYEILNKLMYTFRMPLFFMISGVLMNLSMKKLGLKDYVTKRAQYILYPYLIWAVIQVSLQNLLPQFVNEKTGWSTYLSIIYNPREIEQFWYLHALFCIMVIYSVLKVKLKIPPGVHLAIGLVLFLISQYTYKQGIILYFLWDVIANYIFFAMGDLVSGFLLNRENRDKIASKKLLLINLPVFIALHYYYLLNPSVQLSPFFLVIALSGIILMLNVSFMFEDARRLGFLKVLGANSLYIYLMHVMLMAGARVVMIRFLHIENIPFMLASTILIGLLVPVLAHSILNKYGFWWLFNPNRAVSSAKPVIVSTKETTVA
jgi:fucose 4-O-acetylase-like acetyltransferase